MSGLEYERLSQQMNRLARSQRRWKYLAILALIGFLLSVAPRWGNGQQPRSETKQTDDQFRTEVKDLTPVYVNFCRVTGTPEEMVLDFGMNVQTTPNPSETLKLSNRLAMNYYTLKRLVKALNAALKQHEDTYGILELDVQKRARPKNESP